MVNAILVFDIVNCHNLYKNFILNIQKKMDSHAKERRYTRDIQKVKKYDKNSISSIIFLLNNK